MARPFLVAAARSDGGKVTDGELAAVLAGMTPDEPGQAVRQYAPRVIDVDEQRMYNMAHQLGYLTRVKDMPSMMQRSWSAGKAEGKAEGEARGEARGKARGKADSLHRLLKSRFGSVPPDAAARVAAATPTQLDRWLDNVLDAPSIAAMFAAAPQR